MEYPGIDNVAENRTFFRSVGNLESGSQLGFGFMHKQGIAVDVDKGLFPYYSCSYVIRGKGVYIDGAGKRYPLKPGSLFQRLPGHIHSTIIEPDSQWAECYLDFGRDIYDNFLISMNIVDPGTPVLSVREDKAVEEKIWKLLCELEISPESRLPDLLIDGLELLRTLLSGEAGNDGETDPRAIIEKSCRDFTRDYRRRIDIREYCRTEGIGYETFRKKFRKMTGLSPGRYIIRRRIDMACHLLFKSDLSIKKIAAELGYQSQYEFSSQFKELTGQSPSRYRKNRDS